MSDRLLELVCDNLVLLDQAMDLLESLADADYDRSPQGFEPHRIGGHLRHCVEFYECFLDGLPAGLADYDRRLRDPLVEHDRGSAIERLAAMIVRLSTEELAEDYAILARVEGAAGSEPVESSLARELGFLLSHTIHHFALIAMTMRALGLPVDPGFGVSPSTLHHRREDAACVR